MTKRKTRGRKPASSKDFRIVPVRPDQLDPTALATAFVAAALDLVHKLPASTDKEATDEYEK